MTLKQFNARLDEQTIERINRLAAQLSASQADVLTFAVLLLSSVTSKDVRKLANDALERIGRK